MVKIRIIWSYQTYALLHSWLKNANYYSLIHLQLQIVVKYLSYRETFCKLTCLLIEVVVVNPFCISLASWNKTRPICISGNTIRIAKMRHFNRRINIYHVSLKGWVPNWFVAWSRPMIRKVLGCVKYKRDM